MDRADNERVALSRPFSTRNKIYAGALGVAFAALIYDQCRSSGPARARAAVIPPVAALARPAPEAVASRPVVATVAFATSDIARRLRELAGGSDPLANLRDAFAPSVDWAAERRAAADAAAFPTGTAFAAAHKLSVVLLPRGHGSGAAVIGGRLVRVGQAVDGYRLIDVGPRSVRLTGAAGDVDLRMP